MAKVGFNPVEIFHVENYLLSNYMRRENVEFISGSVNHQPSRVQQEQEEDLCMNNYVHQGSIFLKMAN